MNITDSTTPAAVARNAFRRVAAGKGLDYPDNSKDFPAFIRTHSLAADVKAALQTRRADKSLPAFQDWVWDGANQIIDAIGAAAAAGGAA